MEEFDDLTAFATWFLSQPFGALTPPARDCVFTFDVLRSYVLYRKGQYQVELFTVGENDELILPGEHRHPDVDSFETHLSGKIYFTLNGVRVSTDEQSEAIDSGGSSFLCGKLLRILPTSYHGAYIAKGGGAFLSIQKWLKNVPPTSVGLNWEGNVHAANDREKFLSALDK